MQNCTKIFSSPWTLTAGEMLDMSLAAVALLLTPINRI